MRYTVVFKNSALKELRSLPKNMVKRILAKIDTLAVNPHPSGSIKLADSINRYRIRVGDYRVIYSVEHEIVTVTIITIGHRIEVYE